VHERIDLAGHSDQNAVPRAQRLPSRVGYVNLVNTSPLAPGQSRVPIRTIAAAIGMVLATALALLLVYEVRRILVWIVVALFFTIALYPVVGWLERRARWVPRSLATLVIFLLVLVVIAGLLTAFVVPLAQEGAAFVQQLPQLINDARAGRGPIGRLLERTGALNYMLQNQERLAVWRRG
jgi:predicted PurR-regulated permease PerM